MPNDDYQMDLCGACIRQFNTSLTYKVKVLQSYRKCVCGNCGKESYGAFCRIEALCERSDRQQTNPSRERQAR